MADLETLRTRLEEAESARHRLMTTGATIEIEYEGRRARYSRADAAALDTYIRGLKDQIAGLEGGTTRRRRAIRVTF